MKKIILLLSIVLTSFFASASDTTSVTVQVGASKYSAINVKDAVTGNYLSATITNVSVQNNTPALATVAPNNSTSIKITGVAAGSGTAIVSCHISYTDPGDGLLKSEDKTITLSYTVVGVPNGAKLALLFN
jgi:tartrate dehydratase alpha subunit/fumarate hydratase class I-like protein